MSHKRSLLAFAGAAVSLSVTSGALAQNPDNDRAYLAELIANADERSSLLAAGGGHDGTFHLASADGNYRLNFEGQIQFRYNFNIRDNKEYNAVEQGFQARRTRLFFSGNVINENLTFLVSGDFGQQDGSGFAPGGTFTLRDAVARYQLDNGVGISWGQMRVPLNREEMVDSRYQLAADRSVANEWYNADYSQGIAFDYQEEDWRTVFAFDNGARTANTDFTPSTTEADYAFTGRFEYKFAGDWDRFQDFTSFRGSDYAGMFGVAGHFQQSGNTNAPTDVDVDLFAYTADVSVEADGWNFFAAFMGRYTQFKALGASDVDFNDFAIVAQGGFFVSDQLEVFARYDVLIPDGDRTLDDNFNTITGGVNYYFVPESHAAKLTADVQVFLDDQPNTDMNAAVTSFAPNTGIGLLADTQDSQVNFRLQMQLLF